jgi:hypothetical protein
MANHAPKPGWAGQDFEIWSQHAALVAARFVGFILNTTHSYLVAFAISAGAYLAAFASLQLLLSYLESIQVETSA